MLLYSRRRILTRELYTPLYIHYLVCGTVVSSIIVLPVIHDCIPLFSAVIFSCLDPHSDPATSKERFGIIDFASFFITVHAFDLVLFFHAFEEYHVSLILEDRRALCVLHGTSYSDVSEPLSSIPVQLVSFFFSSYKSSWHVDPCC